jgi:hypothetical protein
VFDFGFLYFAGGVAGHLIKEDAAGALVARPLASPPRALFASKLVMGLDLNQQLGGLLTQH